MNPHTSTEEHLARETPPQTTRTERDALAQCGFTVEEIVVLLCLRQWDQTGGSDRVQMVRHLEFLNLLVLNGKQGTQASPGCE